MCMRVVLHFLSELLWGIYINEYSKSQKWNTKLNVLSSIKVRHCCIDLKFPLLIKSMHCIGWRKQNQNKWGPDIDIKLLACQTEQQPQMRRSHSQSKKSQEKAETKQSSIKNIHQVRSSGPSRSKQQQQKSREPMVDFCGEQTWCMQAEQYVQSRTDLCSSRWDLDINGCLQGKDLVEQI